MVKQLKQTSNDTVLDTVWVIAYPGNRGIYYHPPGTSSSEAWDNCLIFLNGFEDARGVTKAALHKQGFRARKVRVVLA